MSTIRATSEHSLGSIEDEITETEGRNMAAQRSQSRERIRTSSRSSATIASSQGPSTAATSSRNQRDAGEIAPADVDVVVSFRKKKQSVKDLLDDLYESHTQQVGYQTDGHLCIHNTDKQEALHMGASLLYGEVLFEGVSKMLSSQYLAAANSESLYDLGMGTGKLAMQAFFEFPNLRRVVGVEIAFSRYNLAERGVVNLVAKYPADFKLIKWQKGSTIAVGTVNPDTGQLAPEGERRVLEFRREDLFKSFDAVVADIIVLQTDIPVQVHDQLCSMASRFRRGTRVLSYLNFHKIWDSEFFPFPFASFAPNSRFPTSWSPTNGGHMFYLWRKVMPAYRWQHRKTEKDESKFDGFMSLKKLSSLQFKQSKPKRGSSQQHTDTEGGRAGSRKNIFKCIFPKKSNRGSTRTGGGSKK